MRRTELVSITSAAAPTSNMHVVQMAQRARIIGVQFAMAIAATAAAGDSAVVVVEVSTLPVLQTVSALIQPPTGCIAQQIGWFHCDSAGLLTQVQSVMGFIPVDFPVEFNQSVYINAGYLLQVSAGVVNIAGNIWLHLI